MGTETEREREIGSTKAGSSQLEKNCKVWMMMMTAEGPMAEKGGFGRLGGLGVN